MVATLPEKKDVNWSVVDAKYSVYEPTIRQSAQDDRSYRLIKLPNDLQALLISDPNTDKAAASLNVGVGHLSDPDDRPGLAHFCEHLLFMGTEQFPKENAYGEFVSQNGGSTNAYTSTTNTNYHFSVSATALPGALERFSTFFHSPLFAPSGTARELNAVDSENKKNKQSDMWRMFQLDKSLSDPASRWRKFGSGNWESLMGRNRRDDELVAAGNLAQANGDASTNDDGGEDGREVRRRLLDWYQGHYSANRMTLAVLGKESVDELTDLTLKLFSPVPNRKLPPLINDDPALYTLPALNSPWGLKQEGSTIFAKTVMDFRALEIRWVIPWQTPLYKIKPSQIISHFVGHEGYGSIFATLKKKGWIVSLSSSSSGGDRDNGFDFFRVVMVLTKEGWENYASIAKTVYAYLDLLESSPLPKWHYDEIQTIAATAFRFSEKNSPDSYVTHLSETLAKPLAREDILSGGPLYFEWNEAAVRDTLSYFKPEKARITMMSRDDWDNLKVAGNLLFPEGNDGKWDKEEWYGTEHLVRRTVYTDGVAVDGLHLPVPNAYIPTNFEVEKKEVLEPLKRPLKIRETPLSTLWYKKDDRFWVPRANYTFNIRSPLASITPRNSVMTRFFGDLVGDALAERTYDADLAGLSYHVTGRSDGIYVTVSGYSDKLTVLLETILKEIKSFVVDPERFAVQKEQLRQEWQNSELEQPYHLSEQRVAQILRERSWNARERLDELEFVTVDDVQRHLGNLLSRTHIEALIHGNIRTDDALNVMRRVEEILTPRSLTPSERISMRSLILPPGVNYVYDAPVPNKDDVNSGLTYYCQVGDNTDIRLRATLHLLSQIAREPAFNQLRTKEQLGYIVASGHWMLTGTMGFKVTIQSERDPVYLESRVDAFLEQLRGVIEEMSDEEFNTERQSLIDKKLTKLKNLRQETRRFWDQIDSGYHDFRQHEIDVETLKTINQADILSLLKTFVHPDSNTRSKLSVHLRSQTAPSPKLSVQASAVLLKHLKAAGIPVQEGPYNAAAAMELTVAINQDVWTKFFENDMPNFDKNLAKDLVALIAKLAKQYPVETSGADADARLRDGVVYIDDMAELKSRLTLGKAATPVEEYSDLVGSKL